MSRILTTHAGSLPRPAALTADLARVFRNESIDTTAMAQAVQAATEAVVERQLRCGLDLVNDGEMGRESFFTYVQHRMTGFSGSCVRPIMMDLTRYPGYLEEMSRRSFQDTSVSLLTPPMATGEVTYLGEESIRAECNRLAEVLHTRGVAAERGFVTAPSPGIIAAAMENRHYDSLADYVAALATALAGEYRAIITGGFTLQIDAPDLAMERHTLFQDKPLEEFLAFADTVVEAINRATAELPRERVRLHVCWGNYEGAHDCDVPLEAIWPTLANARVGGLMLSMANPRHAHEYRMFANQALPGDCRLIAGVIDTTTNYVEHPLTVADRLERIAAALGGPERLMAGTDCGFETSAGFAAVANDIVWAKLSALVEGAEIASRRLF